MATAQNDLRPSSSSGHRARGAVAEVTPKTPAIKIWAVVGALLLVLYVYVLTDWIAGPRFERVPVGPSDPPDWMKANLIFWQVVSIPIALYCLWRFVVKPWRRDRTLGIDGVLCLAFATLWVQDPFANYGGAWITYNSYLVNFGSWANSLPGFLSYGAPGEMLVEPVLIIPALYVFFFLLAALLGSWVMRETRRRRPQTSALGLIGVCFAVIVVFDLVFEGLIWMPGGIWQYPGGHFPILFPDRFHKFPVQEMLTASATLTAVASIRFFVDDKGRMISERGVENLRGTQRRKTLLRVLATTGAVHLAFVAFYTLPNTIWGLHPTTWPADHQKRSYLTNGICGEGTDRACPGPGVPLVRNDNRDPDSTSGYLSPNGTAVIPKDTKLPPQVPFDRGEPGGDE